MLVSCERVCVQCDLVRAWNAGEIIASPLSVIHLHWAQRPYPPPHQIYMSEVLSLGG